MIRAEQLFDQKEHEASNSEKLEGLYIYCKFTFAVFPHVLQYTEALSLPTLATRTGYHIVNFRSNHRKTL